MSTHDREPLGCPLPLRSERVLLAHGGGGRFTQELLESVFYPAFANPALDVRHDGAVCGPTPGRLAFTTDTHVVRPLVFPGGDIGMLAVCGTVNDLAMCGARPQWLAAAFVLEEGLPLDFLRRIVASMAGAAAASGVVVVTGDTKVVERGHADGLYITTTGVGVVPAGVDVRPARVAPGDVVLASGDLGRHGIAVLAAREGLEFETTVASDCAPLVAPIGALAAAGIDVHCLRDLTRGGLASAVVEIAAASGVGLEIDEDSVPLAEEVRAACEILGLDPLAVACEGRFVAFVRERDAERALAVLHDFDVCRGARTIGRAAGGPGHVTLRTPYGSKRRLDMPSGEELPRIC